MGVWRNFVSAREAVLAQESAPLKRVDPAQPGFDRLVPGADPEDLAGLTQFIAAACEDPAGFFARPDPRFEVEGALVRFASEGPCDADHPNSSAHAQMHDSRRRDAAVVLLPYWNARRAEMAGFAALLARAGIGCLQLSLPYHDERATPDTGYAREMASPDLGLTIGANRQAVRDCRAALGWLEQRGYRRLGVVGCSIGSSIASITAALDERVRTAALLLMADDFTDVVWTGSATRHVREALERRFAYRQVAEAWRIISPATHAPALARRLGDGRVFVASGAIDQVFLPPAGQRYVERLRGLGLAVDWARYGCGHYTLGMPPYGPLVFVRTVRHLRRWL